MPEQQEQQVENDQVKYWMEIAKSFGLPFAMCCVLMIGFWQYMLLQRQDFLDERKTTADEEALEDKKHADEVADFKAEQKIDKTKIIELSVQANQALDKVGDGVNDLSEGVDALKHQGEGVEAALKELSSTQDRFMDYLEKREKPSN